MAEPASVLVDEIRFGPSWASVTPPSEAPVFPMLTIVRSGNVSSLSWPTNAPGFLAEYTSSLSDPVPWTPVAGPVYVVGDQFVVTNAVVSGQTFYRLRQPQ